MVKNSFLWLVICFGAHCSITGTTDNLDPLQSWNDGIAKQKIIKFVKQVTDPDGKDYIAKNKRIAVFDQDGTLWIEKPMYVQLLFAIDRLKEMAKRNSDDIDPQLLSLIDKPKKAIENLQPKEVSKLIAYTHADLTANQFRDIVNRWLEKTKHPKYKKPFTELIYQPMLEVLNFLRANGFKTYLVSAGGQEFMRTFAEKVYGIPKEQVIGSAGKVKYKLIDNKPALIKLPEVLLVDDKAGKPEAINLFIGKPPKIAFGNSVGDKEMLEWTKASDEKNLSILIHHDDDEKEYSYGESSKIGSFPKSLMQKAKENGWIVVSMKEDWKIIFPFEKQKIY